MEKEPWQWEISDIQRLIDSKEKESTYLEYKACAAIDNSSKSKNEISKDISAFANAGGGTIIYGVKENGHVPVEIDEGFDPNVISKEWLEQVITSTIHRRIEGIKINQIDLCKKKGNGVIYVIQIPQSDRAPHQAIDKRYYTRKNFMSVPMEDYEIRDVFMRVRAPNVKLDLFFRRHGSRRKSFPIGLDPETLQSLEINGELWNEGGGEVNYTVITLMFDERLNPGTKQKNIAFRPLEIVVDKKPIKVVRTDINWGGPLKMPLFRTIGFLLLDKEINIHFKAPWLKGDDAPFIQWEVRVPGMEPNIGFYRFRLDRNDMYFKEEEPFEITEVLQNGRNRDFLRTPDLSFNPNLS